MGNQEVEMSNWIRTIDGFLLKVDSRLAYSRLVAMHDDTPKRDHIGPDDAPHRRVHDVIGDLTAGRVTEPARKGLRDALDKADAPPPRRLPDGTHRAPDGRVFRFGAARVGFWVP